MTNLVALACHLLLPFLFYDLAVNQLRSWAFNLLLTSKDAGSSQLLCQNLEFKSKFSCLDRQVSMTDRDGVRVAKQYTSFLL